ncbi:hypothetical protein VCHENC02_2878A, partial [Vibrio harveyi]
MIDIAAIIASYLRAS